MPVKLVKNGALEYLASENICVPHAFTTRLGGVSTGALSNLNISFHRGDDDENVVENIRRLGDAVGFDPRKMVLSHQVHSDTIRAVTADDCIGHDHHCYPQCDALITNTPGLCLMVFTADCTPILLHDPVTGAVGAVHAGWRGTALDLAGKTVRAMAEAYGCKAENIRAAIGPNIGFCCFQTDADVPQAMEKTYGDAAQIYIRPHGDKYYVNLKAINALSLKNAGVTHIEISDACTVCQHQRFWSHRVTGGLRGSQGAVILCKEGRP